MAQYNLGGRKKLCKQGHSLANAYEVTHMVKGKEYPMRLCRRCQYNRNVAYLAKRQQNAA